ncbi:MAG: DUF4175 family protein [Rhodospirillaceae bacterium]|nr:DUF4175 family protein [Rhodospirillaceae bacterium]
MTRDWRDLLRLRRLIYRRLLLSRISIAVERLTRALWAPLTLLATFAAVALFDFLPALPVPVHGIILLGFAAGLIHLIRQGFISFTWPSVSASRHRLETASTVSHRPLTAWEDNLGYKAGPGQNTLWLVHRLRMQHLIAQLTPPWPAAIVAARDPYAIRSLLVLLCLAGVIGAQGDIGPRFVRAINPSLARTSGPINVKVWLTPPAYTQRPPVLLDPDAALPVSEAIIVPSGTHVLAIVTGTARTTRLGTNGEGMDLEAMDDDSLRYEGVLPEGNLLEVRQTGQILGAWPIAFIPDNPPLISLTDTPDATGRYRSRFNYRATDDYGVVSVGGRIDRPEEARSYAQNWGADFTLSVPPLAPKTVEHQSFHDLSAHPWAGKTVTLTLSARDAAGQTGISEADQFLLPERSFSHPVAATIIQYRKDLINDPSTAPIAARALGRLMEVPTSYGGDVIAHLSMASAQNRLQLHDSVSVLDSVIDLMWRAALRIEDGTFAVAEQALNDAENALNKAIKRGASTEEISRLISRLQRALMEYYQALAEEMPDGTFPMSGSENDMQAMGSEDIAQVIEQLRQLSEMGADSAAKEMMANLRNMLETLRNTALSPMDHPDVEAARKMMEELKEITEQQSDMLNKTFEQARQQALSRNQEPQRRRNSSERRRGEQGQTQPPQTEQDQQDRDNQQKNAAGEQSELRQRLEDLMGRMAEMTGDISEDMGNAEQAMREAEDALGDGAWRSASGSQSEALANLQNGMQGAAQQLMQALAEQGLAGLIPMPGQAGQPLDALGPNLGPDQGKDIELPSEPDTRGLSLRSRAILEEIRKRASQRVRSNKERQYLRRLLEQF